MSLMAIEATITGNRFPRVSGDEPVCVDITYYTQPFSPRERG